MNKNVKISSPLGDYIHLTSKGYLNHGTSRNRKQISDYDPDIFSRFQQAVITRTRNNAIFKEGDVLKKAEQQYNENRRKNYETIKKLFSEQKGKDENFSKEFTAALLKAANLPNLDAEIAEKIISFEEGKEDAATARGLSFIQEGFSKNKMEKVSAQSGEKYTLLETIRNNNNMGRLKSQISLAKAAIQNSSKQFQIIQEAEREYQDLENFLNSIEKSKKLLSRVKFNGIDNNIEYTGQLEKYDSNLETFVRYNSSTNKIEIASPLAKVIYLKIRDIQNKIKISNSFNSLQAGFSEIMAALSSETIENKTNQEILKIIEEGVKGTQVSLVSKEVKKVAGQTIAKFSLKGDFFGLDIVQNLASGKVDAVLKLQDENVYASVKNYNLGREEYWDATLKQKVPSTISLVSGTPLSSLLLVAESYQKKLGTHFLNILTEKEDGLNKLTNIRNSGLEALKIFLIYTALTGGHGDLGLRDTQGANLLIIEDKATQRAYLFSINSILDKAVEDMNNFKLSFGSKNGEPLENLVLENKRIQDSNNREELNTKARLENVLSFAHKTKLYAAINSSTIKNMINSR